MLVDVTEIREPPTLTSRGVTVATSSEGVFQIPVMPSSLVRGVMLHDDDEPISIAQTTASCLTPGNLLYLAVPLLPYRVVATRFCKNLGGPTGRVILSLSDATGEIRDFSVLPHRVMYRVAIGSIPLAPWRGLPLAEISEVAHEDALTTRLIKPIRRILGTLLQGLLDLQCHFYYVRLHIKLFAVVIAVSAPMIILAIWTEVFASAVGTIVATVASIVGAFIIERTWVYSRQDVRRNLVTGFSMRIRFRPFGTETMKYVTLDTAPHNAMTKDLEPWFTTRLSLMQGGQHLAVCTFANDLAGDERHSCRAIVNAIRHRIESGSRRVIHGASVRHGPKEADRPTVAIFPGKKCKEFSVHILDDKSGAKYELKLKRYQMSTLADALDVMDEAEIL